MRQAHGSACGANELCFAGVQHDFRAASLQVGLQSQTNAELDEHPALLASAGILAQLAVEI